MRTLASYVNDRFVPGEAGSEEPLLNPATEEVLAMSGSGGVDRRSALAHARTQGGAALRALTFAERGALLKAMSDAIVAHRDEILDLAVASGGNTRSDAKFDVDGATFTLSAYAEIGKSLGASRVLADGDVVEVLPPFAGG